MPRLIDADALYDKVFMANCGKTDCGKESCNKCCIKPALKFIEDAPTVDAEPVVRCKNCRYFNKYGFKLEYTECTHFDCDVTEEGYCAWGERK